jgi:hypothetical protein
MAVLKRQGLLTLRYSTDLANDAELTRGIDEADMILVLLTPALVNSSQWTGLELQQAKAARDQRSIPVIPIIVERCAWTESWLGRFVALPQNGKPLSSMPDATKAWAEIAQGLQRVLTRRQPRAIHAPPIAEPNAVSAPALAPALAPAASDGWGDLSEVRLAYRRLDAYHTAMLRLVDAARRAAEKTIGSLEHQEWQPGVLRRPGESAAPASNASVDHIPCKRISYTWASLPEVRTGQWKILVVHNGDGGSDGRQIEPSSDARSTLSVFVTHVVRAPDGPNPKSWGIVEHWLASTPGFSPTDWEDGEVHVGNLSDTTLRFGGFARDMALLLASPSDEHWVDPLRALITRARSM